MRILYVGQFSAEPPRDQTMASAFRKLGHEVVTLDTLSYVNGNNFFNRVERHFLSGPSLWRLWRRLIRVATETKPDLVYFRRPVEFPPSVILQLKETVKAPIVEYMNDDPFGPDRNKHWLKYFHKTIPLFDLHFAFREINVDEFYSAGAKRVEVLLTHYDGERHHPFQITDQEKRQFGCDAIFLGHCEDDSRIECFDAIIESGMKLNLGGSKFENFAKGRLYHRLLPVHFYAGDQYCKAIQTATCSLCFFSSRNRDVLTDRVFEIPGCEGVLVAQRNPVVTKFFEEGQEAFFFSSPRELVEIVKTLKLNAELRNYVAQQGRKKLLRGNHEIADRARQVLKAVYDMKHPAVTPPLDN